MKNMIRLMLRFFVYGVLSAVVCGLTWILPEIILPKEMKDAMGLFIVLSPAIVFALLLAVFLYVEKKMLARRWLLRLPVLLISSLISWIGAMVLSTFGIDFRVFQQLPIDSFWSFYKTGLLPYTVSILIMGMGVYICSEKPRYYSVWKIFLMYLSAGLAGLAVYCLVHDPAMNLIGSIEGSMIGNFRIHKDVLSVVYLFLIWQVSLYLVLPFTTRKLN